MIDDKINVPKRLADKLLENDKWHASATMFLNNIKNYFTTSPKFFPEYTIHGIAHVNMTISMADLLISDETLAKLAARDIAVLLAAIAIHDIGMFITEDGLFDILYGQYCSSQFDNLDKKSWKDEWGKYIAKVKRYSDQQLLTLFNDPRPISEPTKEIAQMTKKDYLLYGEFLRRFHHRMAHHIAINGFPGSKTRDIFENTGELMEQKDIIGLIARSHCMHMRDTEDYIAANFADDKFPNNFPVFYLMSVLRIADYLDAGKHRAPFELEDRQEISVSISKKEWIWNQCIDIENYTISKEKGNITIQARPKNTLEFVKVENWLKDIQHELDLCWSVLAEKYGVESHKLTIHRVQSNLLSEKNKKQLSKLFLTREASLKANVELLKLLIAPLYGDNPSFGVREMIQNAVDACIERQFLEKKNGNIVYEPLITVSIDTYNKLFKIEDNGIGMNEDVLIDYYLSAGSSYRYSDSWKKDFAVDRKDQIARTGKFGVGVLSSFLLGDTVNVTTRRYDEELGYKFQFTMEQSGLNVFRTKCDSGTTIEIAISDNTIEKLLNNFYDSAKDWNEWYAFKAPQIKYYVDGKEVNANRTYVPNTNENYDGWFNYESELFNSFQWTYDKIYGYFCNGIAIPEIEGYEIGSRFGLTMNIPSLSIVDKECNLKINLARSAILSFPEEESFIREAYKCYLAKLLISNKDAKDYSDSGFVDNFTFGTDKSQDHPILGHYLVSEDGFSVFNMSFAVALNLKKLLLFCYKSDFQRLQVPNLGLKLPCVLLSNDEVRHIDRSTYYYNIDDLSINYEIQCAIMNNLFRSVNNMSEFRRYYPYPNQRTILQGWTNKDVANYISSTNRFPFRIKAFPSASNNISNRRTSTFSFSTSINFELFLTIAEIEINGHNDVYNNIMLEVIREYLGENDIWIPYEFEERKKKFPKAFQELKKYM